MAETTSKKIKVNTAAWDKVRNDPRVHNELAAMAQKVAEAANQWSGAPADKPDFWAIRSPGKHRARYTVGPCTGRGVWFVNHDPAGFIACLNAAKEG